MGAIEFSFAPVVSGRKRGLNLRLAVLDELVDFLVLGQQAGRDGAIFAGPMEQDGLIS